jgi:phage gp29-like protein
MTKEEPPAPAIPGKEKGVAFMEEPNKDHTDHLLDLAKARTAAPAASLLDAAEALLNTVDSLEAFRERLIDLYAQSDPERLAEVLAQMELLGNLAGRLEAKEEGLGADGTGRI